MIVVCTVLLSLQPFIIGEVEVPKLSDQAVDSEAPVIVSNGELLPTWMPVLFGVLTPVCFTLNNTLLKVLTDEERQYKFNGSTISMTGIFVVNVLILIFAIVFWQYYHFSQDLFWLGLIGSIINTCGLTFMNTAIS